VPEGFYRISGFNPQSQFLLSMRVSYPNALDRRLKHSGGDIFIHGSWPRKSEGGRAEMRCNLST
jgi:murein L,D-transpeptidase YafK